MKITRTRALVAAVTSLALTTTLTYAFTSREESGVAPAAATSFSEQLRNCEKTNDRYGCLNELVKQIPVEDLSNVDMFFAAVDNDTFGPGCYSAAETLGIAAWNRNGAAALGVGTPKCEAGYVHGALIAARASGEPFDFIATGCATAKEEQNVPELWTPSMMLTCLVGTGRAYASAGDVDNLVEGVALCETHLKNDRTEERGLFKAIDFCVRGVVYDLLDADTPVREAVDECLTLGGSRTDACLGLGLRNPASRNPETVRELAQECVRIENDTALNVHSKYCYFVLSDVLAQKLYFERFELAPDIVEICGANVNCTGHYAKFLLTATWDPAGTIEACKLLRTGALTCAESVPALTRDGIEQGHIPAEKASVLPPEGTPVLSAEELATVPGYVPGMS